MTSPLGNQAYNTTLQDQLAADAVVLPMSSSPGAASGSSTLSGTTTTFAGRKPVSRSKKAIAACSGAITTSFLMTPFDVVKTRLQTQAPSQPLFVPGQYLGPPHILSTSGQPQAQQKSQRAIGKQKAVSAASSGTGTNATCCKPTFFTNNAQYNSLTCRYDPRLDRATSSFQAASAAAAPSSSSYPSSSSSARSWTASSAPSLGKRHTTSASSSSTSAAGHVVSKQMKLASTCAFPDRAIAQRVLLAGGTGGEAAFFSGAGAATSASKFWERMRSTSGHGGSGIAGEHLHVQPNSGGQRLTGLWDGVIRVGRTEGIRGLWRGLTPTLLMTIPSQVTYMTCYDLFRDHFLAWDSAREGQAAAKAMATEAALQSGARGGNNAAARIPLTSGANHLSSVTTQSLIASLTAGALARAISATLVTPLELLRTRLQASSALSSADSFSGNLRALRQQVHADGITVLWRGLGSTLWRDVPFSALYFAGYEAMKRAMTGGGLGEGHAKGHGEEFGIAFISGATSGTIAAIATHPFDVVKTRLQAARSSSSARQAGRAGRATPTSTTAIVRSIYASEGVQGLFRGLSPRVAKVAPACGVMIASFEVVGRFLADM